MRVHLVTFDPINGNGVGGFDWNVDVDVINDLYEQYVRENEVEDSHRVRQFVVEVDDNLTHDEITAQIDAGFVADRTEIIPLRDSHLYDVSCVGVESGDGGRDFVQILFDRGDGEALITAHQSAMDQPFVNIEIDGTFAGEGTHATGALCVNLNDSPIYISMLDGSEIGKSELVQYERHLREQLAAVQDTLKHI